MVKYSPFIHIPDRMARKAGDVSAADWRYHTHVKKYDIFSGMLLGLFRPLVNQFNGNFGFTNSFWNQYFSVNQLDLKERKERINKLFIGLR